jgi:hypothetical protein
MALREQREPPMGIDRESDVAADLRIGPTSLGMVRIYIEGAGLELPLDFEPDEAEEIAEELRSAAERARAIASGKPAGATAAPGPGRGRGAGRGGRRPRGRSAG